MIVSIEYGSIGVSVIIGEMSDSSSVIAVV